MKTYYLINGFWECEDNQIPEFCGLYATRELAEEAFHKLTALLDEQGYKYYLFITEVPFSETSNEVDTLIDCFRHNIRERKERIFYKEFSHL